jgi:hypothetical protein
MMCPEELAKLNRIRYIGGRLHKAICSHDPVWIRRWQLALILCYDIPIQSWVGVGVHANIPPEILKRKRFDKPLKKR